jgi:hypothetical protein
MPFIDARSMTSPPSQTAFPATLWPPPRTAMGRPRSMPNWRATITSATPVQRAMAAGRLSTIPLWTRRAVSYSGWVKSITAPRMRALSASNAGLSSRSVIAHLPALTVCEPSRGAALGTRAESLCASGVRARHRAIAGSDSAATVPPRADVRSVAGIYPFARGQITRLLRRCR